MDDDWIEIKKTKKNNKTNKNTKIKTNEEIISIITDTLKIYNPSHIFLYGSRARKTHRIDSDVDLIVFWKYPAPSIDDILIIKSELINNIGLNVDFVNMVITNKYISVYDERTLCYYDNISRDGINIYNTANNIDLKILLNYSVRITS